ncbi:hypothetical protein [Endozoicomonas sp. ALD040]|uniref:hypothetical protein n=1 Tax=Endozoicomonas sp. ALD040 TaxID=3403079 RepID=UPI003BAF6122
MEHLYNSQWSGDSQRVQRYSDPEASSRRTFPNRRTVAIHELTHAWFFYNNYRDLLGA